MVSPNNPDAIDTLIDDAVSSGVLTEKEDGPLKYNGAFITIPLDVGGEIRIDIEPRGSGEPLYDSDLLRRITSNEVSRWNGFA